MTCQKIVMGMAAGWLGALLPDLGRNSAFGKNNLCD
jgi:hypothetical protein